MSSAKPKQADGVESRELGDECMLHDGRNGSVHIINATAAFVWGLCDGRRTVDEIVSAVADAYEIFPNADMHKDVEGILADFSRQNVIQDFTELSPGIGTG
jgi:hypothetical protein